MIILIIFTVILAFVFGFSMGLKNKPKVKAKTFKNSSKNLQTVEAEYHNFLNYDGSVQQ